MLGSRYRFPLSSSQLKCVTWKRKSWNAADSEPRETSTSWTSAPTSSHSEDWEFSVESSLILYPTLVTEMLSAVIKLRREDAVFNYEHISKINMADEEKTRNDNTGRNIS